MSSFIASCRWIPWTFAGALGLVVVVNAAFAYIAVSTSPGLVTDHPYTEGTGYNRVLAQGEAQDALGWRGTISFTGMVGAPGELAARLIDRTGKPLDGVTVTAHIIRPVEALPEIAVSLPETAAGRYAAATALSRPGQWEVQVAARRGADLYEFAQRIIVK